MALPPVIRVLRINSLFHIVRAAGLQGSFSSLHPVSEETPPSAAIRKSRRETFMRQLFLKAAAALALFGVAAAHGIAAAQAKTYDLPSGVGLQVPSRSEERRVGKGCVSTCRFRGSPD